jgi:hypothetical protein
VPFSFSWDSPFASGPGSESWIEGAKVRFSGLSHMIDHSGKEVVGAIIPAGRDMNPTQ